MKPPDKIFEDLESCSDDELLARLGLAAQHQYHQRVEGLKAQDFRNAVGSGKRWFAEFKDKARETICGTPKLRKFVASEISDRVAMGVIIASALLKIANVNEEGAVAFAVLLTREGLRKYCKSEWG